MNDSYSIKTGILNQFSTSLTAQPGTDEFVVAESTQLLQEVLKQLDQERFSLNSPLQAVIRKTASNLQVSAMAKQSVETFIAKFQNSQAELLLQSYLLALRDDDCSESTIKNYRSDIRQFLLYTQENAVSRVFTKPKVAQFLRNEKNKGLTKSSIRRKVVSISQFALWLELIGVIRMHSQQWLVELSQHFDELYMQQLSGKVGGDVAQIKKVYATTLPDEIRTKTTPIKKANVPVPAAKASFWSRFINQSKLNLKSPRVELSATLPKGTSPLKGQDRRFQLKQRLYQLQSRLTNRSKVHVLPYLNLLLSLVLFLGMGYFGYLQIFREVEQPLAFPSALTRPNRTLSFQGRLTDTAQNPILVATNMRFRLYDSGPSTSGGNLLWDSGTCSVTPDQDGIFAVGLGADCGGEIGSSVFSENANVWLQVEVASEVLSPRQSIKSVAYALNSETLQGYPASASAVENTVVVMNNSGEIVLGNANPVLKATGTSFAIEAQTLTLRTSSGSNGNIVLDPDGTGKISLLANVDVNGYIKAPGATLSATYAGGTALTLNAGPSATADIMRWQNSAGSTLGVIDESGNIGIGTSDPTSSLDVRGIAARIQSASNLNTYLNSGAGTTSNMLNFQRNGTSIGRIGFDTTNDIFTFQSDGAGAPIFIRTNGAQYISLVTNGSNEGLRVASTGNVGLGSTSPSQKLDVVGAIRLGAAGAGNVLNTSTSAAPSGNLFWGDRTVCDSSGSCGSGFANYWRLNLGTISPVNDTLDFLVGANATASAKFAVLNVNNGGTPIASVSSGLSGTSMFMTANGTLSTTRRQSLTIGNSSTYNTTGDVLINPNGTGNVGIGTTSTGARVQIQGTGTTNATSALRITNSTPTTMWDFLNDGTLQTAGNVGKINFNMSGLAGSTTALISVSSQNSSTTQRILQANDNASRSMAIDFTTDGSGQRNFSFNDGTSSFMAIRAIPGHPAGNLVNYFQINPTIAPTSGSSSGAIIYLNPTINQTGGANGITRGLHIAPTLTSAADWRAIETTVGNIYLGTSSGNVGIGTTTALARLDIAGSASTSGTLAFRGTTDPKIDILNGEAFGIRTSVGGDAGLTERLTILNNGNIGIGSTAPTEKVNVAGSITGAINSYTANGVSYGSNFFTSETLQNGKAGVVGAGGPAGLVIPTITTYGSVGVVGGSRIPSGNRTSVGVYGYGNIYGHSGASTADNASGIYGLAELDSGVTNFTGMLYGIRGRADSTTATSQTDGDIYAIHGTALGEGANTTYGGYFTASGGTTNYGVYSAAGTNYFNGNVGIGTTSASNELEINGTTPAIRFINGGTQYGLIGHDGTQGTLYNYSGALHINNIANAALQLKTNNTTRIDIEDDGDINFNANDVFFQNSSGNVGIGSLTPSQKLDVVGAIRLGAAGAGNVLNTSASAAPTGNLFWGDRTVCDSSGSCGAAGANYWKIVSGMISPGNESLDFAIGGAATSSAKFAVLNVIGSGTPTASISSGVSGNSMFMTADGKLGTSRRMSLEIGNSSGFDTTGNVLINSNGTGNVGIGTTNPASNLEIYGTTNPRIRISSGAATAPGLTITQSGQTSWTMYQPGSSSDLRFSQGGDLITFQNGGNVGIGTTVPSRLFDVEADTNAQAIIADFHNRNTGSATFSEINVSSGSTAQLRLGVTDDTYTGWTGGSFIYSTHANGRLGLGAANAERMSILPNGNIGIATTAPASRLDIDTGSNTLGLRLRGTAETVEIADMYVGAGGELVISNTSGTDTAAYLDLRSEDDQYGLIVRESDGTGTATFANLYVVDATDDYLSINLNAVTSGQALNIAAGNNIGIGTTAPVYKLDVLGTGRFSGLLNTSGISNATNAITNSAAYTQSGTSANTFTGTTTFSNATYSALFTGGNVGIGTTTPHTNFVLATAASSNPSFSILDGDVSQPFTSAFTPSAVSTELGRIAAASNTDGGLQIAGISDSAVAGASALYLQGFLGSASPTAAGVVIEAKKNNGAGAATSLSATEVVTQIRNNTADLFTVLGNGNIGIGSTAPVYKLDVNGTGRFTGALELDSTLLDINAQAGTAGQVLSSTGSGVDWVDTASLGTNYWKLNLGTLSPFSDTLDLLVGSGASDSAKFAVLNVNSGTPTASISSGVSGNSMFMTADGRLSTTRKQSLIIGNSSGNELSGNVLLQPQSGNVGIGTTIPGSLLNLAAGTTAAGGITFGTDTTLYRSAADSLRTDDNFFAYSLTTGGVAASGTEIRGASNIYAYLGSAAQTGIGNLGPGSESGILFGNGGDTNLYRSAANTLRTSDSLIVDGNVGIGSTTPGAKLDVNGDVLLSGGTQDYLFTSQATELALQSQNSAGNSAFGLYSKDGDGTDYVSLQIYGVGTPASVTNRERLSINYNVDNTFSITTNAAGTGTVRPLTIYTGSNTSQLSIATSGNVGIGSASPSYRLDVAGTGRFTGALELDSTLLDINAQAGTAGQVLSSTGSGVDWVDTASLGTNYWKLNLGTLSPFSDTLDLLVGSGASDSAKFAVLNVNSGTPTASVSSGVSGNGMYMTANGTLSTTRRSNLTIGNSSTYNTTGNVLINPNGTGNVGIGSTAPSMALDVVGTGRFTGLLTTTGISNSSTAITNSAAYTQSGTSANTFTGTSTFSNGTYSALFTGGNVGIGSATPGVKLDVTGDIRATTGYYYGSTAPLSLELTRTLSATTNDTVELGSLTIGSGGHNVRINVTASLSGFSVAKQYLIPVQYGQTAGAWQIVNPISSTGAYGSEDFALEVNVNNAVATFRLRKTTGSTGGNVQVRVESTGSTADTWASSTTTSTSAITTIFSSTPLTQVAGNVGIGTTAPGTKLDVTGTGRFSSTLTASNGLTLSNGALNLTATSGTLNMTGMTAFTFNGSGNFLIDTANFDVTATGINNTAIGATTPSTGAFTTLSSTGVTTIGNNSATVAINSSDWDISTTGDMTGIGALTMDGNFSQTGATTFSTGTGAVSLNGATTVANGQTFTANGVVTLGDGGDNFSVNSNALDISTAGAITGATGITSSGNIIFSGLTAGRAVFTTTGGQLTSTGASADLLASLSDETGTGVAVFGTSPAITTSLTTGSSSFDLLNTTATTINFGGAASTLNIGPGSTTATSVNIAGGNAATGCTVDGATGNLTCTGSITGSGATGYWNRVAGNISPATANDTISATSSASTVATFTTNNPAGTLTNNTVINQTGAGTVTNLLNLTQTAGTVSNGLTFTGTFGNLISATNFSVTNAGAVTAVGVNSGSGLLQGTGGLTISGTNSITGATTINTSGTANTTIGNSAGGTITIGAASGSDLVLNDAQWSVTGAGTFSGPVFQGNSGAVTFGNVAQATTITGSGLTVVPTSWTATPTISGLITATSGLTANGALTANNTFTLGDNGDTGSVNTSDWDISTTGAMTGISGITNDAALTSTGGVVSLNASSNFAVNIGTGTTTSTVSIGGNANQVAIDSSTWDITGAGVASGLTGLTSSGTVTFSGLTANRAVFTTTGGQLTSTGASADLLASLSDETGTGVAVFGTSPAITTSLTTGSSSFDLLNTTATTINFGGAASTLNIGPGSTTATSVNIAGGNAATGCTVDGATGNLTCTGSITGSGATGYWTRVAGNISPATANDTISATSSASTVATFTSSNPAGTITNNTLINKTGAGTVTNLLNLTQTAGTVSNGLTFTGTFGNLISATNFTVTNGGAVTAVGVNSGSGLLQGTGGLTISGTNSITGATTINTSGTANTTIGNSAGGTITIGASSGSDLALNDAQWSVTGAGTFSGPVFQGNSGAVTFGNVAQATTITGSGLTIVPTAWTATPTISGLITATSGLTANGALTANNTFTLGDNGDTGSINTSDWDISTAGAMTGISGITNDSTFTTSGGAVNINDSSNFATNINTGTSNGALSLGGGSGTVAVNSTTWDISTAGVASGFTGLTSSGTITFSGLSNGIVKSTSGVLSGGNSVILTSEVSGILPIANGGTNSTATPTNGGVAYGTGSAYAFTSAGTSGYVLRSNGAAAPTWIDPAGLSTNYWKLANGTVSPFSDTLDLLVGSNATASAKFAFMNVNSGTPTASIAGNLAIAVPTGANPATTYDVMNGGSFRLRTSVGGNAGLTERLSVTNEGYVGVGEGTPNTLFHVRRGTNASATLDGLETDALIQDWDTSAGVARLDLLGGSSGAGVLAFNDNAASAGEIRYNHNDDSLRFKSNATEYLSLLSDGNFGIGDTTPTYRLDVNGTGRFTGAVDFDGDIELNSTLTDINGSVGTSGQILTSTSTGVDWVDVSTIDTDDQTLAEVLLQGNSAGATGIDMNNQLITNIGNAGTDFTSGGGLNLAGALSAVGVNSNGGLLQGTGGLTLTGTTSINTSGTANTTIGNTAGGTITIGAASGSDLVLNDAQWSVTGAGTFSGPVFQGNSGAVTFGNVAQATTITGSGLTVVPTSWTATPTISGLITATSGLTANGALTANNTFTLGDNGDVGSINTSDWDISTTGDMTGIGAITMNGNFSQTGATTFSTGTGAVSLNGSTTVANGQTFTANGTVALGDGGDNFSVNSNALDISTGGAITGATGITSSGNIIFSGLTAGRAVFTTTGGQLTSTGASADLLASLSDETGTGVAVFGTSPAITTSLTTGSTSFDLLNTTATTINFGGAASTLNIGPGSTTATSVNIAGGSGATGCTVDGATGNLTCTGSITGSGATGYWTRVAGNISPATVNDTISATSSASTVATFTTSNPAGTITNNTLINKTGAGTVTNLLNLTQTAGTVSNGLTFTGTFGNLISATNFSVTNAGAVTAVGVNSGSGLLQGTGGLTISGTNSITGATTINTSGTANTTIGNTAGGTITIGAASGSDLVLNDAQWSVTGAGTFSGPVFQGNSGAVTFGNVAQATTITGSGLTVVPTAWTATPTISGLITATSGLTANGALTANNTFTLGDNGDTGSVNTSDWDISTTGAMTGISGITNDAAFTTSGGIISLNASSNFAVNIGTGTTTSTVSIGGNANQIVIDSSTWNVSGAGVASGLTGITSSGTITFSGLSNGIVKSTSGVLSGGNTVTLTSEVSGILPIANGGTNSTATPTNGGVAYGTGSAYAFTSAGTSGYVLRSNGAAAPTWVDPAGLSTNYWKLNLGTVSPFSDTLDLLVGSSASDSAKFAVLNVNSGTPTASVSSGVSGNGMYMTADGTLSTTRRSNLTIGNSSTYNTTGSVLINPNGTGNVGIGTTATGARLSVLGISNNANVAEFVGDRAGSNINMYFQHASAADTNNSARLTFQLNTTVQQRTAFEFISGFADITDASRTSYTYFAGSDNGSYGNRMALVGSDFGIGTITPTARLDINGSASTSATLAFRGTTDPKIDILNGENLSIQTSPGGNAGLTSRLTILNNGNVGIGTVTPSNELEINGDLELTNLYDNDGSNFFDGGCSATTTVTGIDSTGAITCTTITGVTASSIAFSGITSGTNTVAAMLVGAGASLDYTSTGTINASSLIGGTWAIPGAIGSTTPNSGAFTTLTSTGVTTLGNNSATVAVNSSDWDISTTGAMTGISGITNDAAFTTSGGVVSLNASSNFAVNIGTGTTTSTVSIGGNANQVAIDSSTWDITGAGVASGLTGLTSSGTVTFSGLTANRAVFTTTGGQLTSTGASADLLASLSDETGTGVAVFGTSPAITTSLTTGSSSFDLLNTTATTINFGGAASTLNIGPGSTTATSVNIAGGSGATGCTVDGATGNLTCTGNIASTGGSVGFWQYGNGAISPSTPYTNNSDLLIGSNATASAKFAVLNVYPGTAGSPTASISSGLSGNSMFMTADGSLSTTRRLNLTIGNSSSYNTTGNVLINSNGTGNVGIGNAAPASLFSVGSSSQFQVNSSGNIVNIGSVAHSISNSSGNLLINADTSAHVILNNNGGNVGIGNGLTSPTSRLHVRGSSGEGSASIRLDSLNGGAITSVFIENNDASSQLTMRTFGNGYGGTIYGYALTNFTQVISNSVLAIGTSTADDLVFSTNNTARMTVDSTGSVGIGTATPSNNLHVYDGASGAGPGIIVESAVGNASINLISDTDIKNASVSFTDRDTSTGYGGIGLDRVSTKLLTGSAQNDIAIYTVAATGASIRLGAEGATAMSIIPGGNVGIGSTSPQAKLELVKDTPTNGSSLETDYAIRIVDGTDDVGLLLGVSATDDASVIQSLDPGTGWGTRPLALMPKAGNVGIGTTVPNSLLDLANTTQLSNRMLLSGQEYYQAANTSTSGVAVRLGVNRTNNRQVWFADSAAAINTTNAAFRVHLGSTYASIGGVSTDGTVARDLALNLAGANVGVGTSVPNQKLQVYDTVDGDVSMSISNNYYNSASTDDTASLRFQFLYQNAAALSDAAVISAVKTSTYQFAGNNNADLVFSTENAASLTEKMRIQANGNVGIGVTNPDKKLEVNVTASTDGIKIDGTTNPALSLWTSGTLRGYLSVATAGGSFLTGSTANDIIIRSEADDIIMGSGSTPALTITSGNNVGIGTITAASKLDIDTGSNTSGLRLRGLAETAEIADILIDSAGQLVISTVAGTDTGGYLDIRSEDDQYGLILRESDGTGTGTYANIYVVDATTDYASFTVNSATSGNALVVTAGNNVGIGTSNPTQKLEVVGVTTTDGLESNVTGTADAVVGNAQNSAGILGTSSGFYAGYFVRSSGGGVGYFQNTTANCTITPGAGTPFACPSDSRLKKDITTIDNSLNAVLALRGVKFRWNADSSDSSLKLGFIAQEVEAVVPELVTTGENGYKRMDYSVLTPLLVNAIQEQQAEIDSLAAVTTNVTFSNEGTLTINGSNGNYTVTASGNTLTTIIGSSKAVIAKITAGLINTRELVVTQTATIADLSVNSMRVSGQNISDYIRNIVQQELQTTSLPPGSIAEDFTTETLQVNQDATISGSLAADTITTNTITATTSALGSLLAETATISGDFTVQQDASVAGTLIAGTIEAESSRFNTLEARMAELENIKAQTAELVDATISGTLYADSIYNFDEKVAESFKKPSLLELLTQPNENPVEAASPASIYEPVETAGYQSVNPDLIATDSAILSLNETDVVLGASALFVEKYLEVNGFAYVSQTLGVGDTLKVGNSLRITNGTIDYQPEGVDAPVLALQSSGRGKLDLLAGVMTIEAGHVKVTGNVTVAGALKTDTLLTNLAQPADFGTPFQVQVAGVSTESGELKKTRFEIINETGQAVASFDADGNASFQGGVSVGNQNLTAEDSSDDTVNTDKSSGKAKLASGKDQLKIQTPKATPDSLIYVTPKGSTENKVLFIKGQGEGEFTVGFDTAIGTDVEFNWWIVN